MSGAIDKITEPDFVFEVPDSCMTSYESPRKSGRRNACGGSGTLITSSATTIGPLRARTVPSLSIVEWRAT